jgi:hypothetical protein
LKGLGVEVFDGVKAAKDAAKARLVKAGAIAS